MAVFEYQRSELQEQERLESSRNGFMREKGYLESVNLTRIWWGLAGRGFWVLCLDFEELRLYHFRREQDNCKTEFFFIERLSAWVALRRFRRVVESSFECAALRYFSPSSEIHNKSLATPQLSMVIYYSYHVFK